MERSPQSIRGISSDPTAQRPLLKFFLLLFVLTVPFLVIGAATGAQLLPGVPLASLAFVCPGLAAVVLVRQGSGSVGVKALLMRPSTMTEYRRKSGMCPFFSCCRP